MASPARRCWAPSWPPRPCAAWVYTSPRARASRYLLPGLATFAVFVLMPLLYTVYIAFTNFSGEHLLSQERVRAWFAQDVYAPVRRPLTPSGLHPAAVPGQFQVVVPLVSGARSAATC
jgi:ABC-type sugar transport system permease subunit